MNEYINKSIQCSITDCAHHCCDANKNYCVLEKIKVGGASGHTSDCQSFAPAAK